MNEDKLCGIYKIQNKNDGKIYIGQTVDFERRMNEYKNRKPYQNKGYKYHIMYIIQNEGIDNFTFEFIHPCDKEDLDKYEMFYINTYKSYDTNLGYNSFHINDDGKLTVNDLTRDKMKISHIGLKETSNTKRKKSNKIVAIDDSSGIVVIADSAKLFGDIIGYRKDIIKNKLREPAMILGYHLYYFDSEKRNEILSKVKKGQNKHTKLSYLVFGEFLNNASVETIEREFLVINLTYEMFE